MATTITASATNAGRRALCATSTGRLWQATQVSTTIQMWYSDDSGATWTQNTTADFTTGASASWSLFIDQDDHAHIAYAHPAAYEAYYRRMPSIGTATSWSEQHLIEGDSYYFAVLGLVMHRHGTGWAGCLATSQTSGSSAIRFRHIAVSSAGAITGPALDVPAGTSGFTAWYGLDFHHTASDVKAVQGSTPHYYAAWAVSSDVRFIKATYSGGSWTWGTYRTIAASVLDGIGSPSGDLIFDGTRVVVVAQKATTSPTVGVWERDAADTTTTDRSPGTVTLLRPKVTYDGNEDVWVVGEVSTTDVKYRVYDRSGNTWGSETTLEAEGVLNNTMSVRRGGGYDIDTSWDASSGLRFERVVAPHPPTAPTWVSPVDFAGADVGASLVLDWMFNDPYPGDTQGKYAVRRQIGTGTLYYWRASDSTWQTTETANVSATTSLTLASGWGSDGDDNHTYAVKTWDSGDAEGTYSANLTVVPSSPDLPTITTPADASTHVTSSITVEWSVATQTTYLVELLDAAGTTVLWSSGTQTSTGTRSQAVSYTLLNGVDYKVRVTTANDEGLVGTADTNSFSVAYTAPATPTLTVTANTPTGAITVAHANPTPTGSQPDVTSCDVFVRCTAGTYPDGDRPVAGDGIRVKTGLTPGANWIDYAPASGRAYQYMVRAYGDNGTTGDSAWTA